jgi:protein phosphatase
MEDGKSGGVNIKSENIQIKSESELDLKRFGHTLTLINFNQVVLFGGARSVTDLYNDTHIYNIQEKSWIKLNPSGDCPSARAAHAATCRDKDNLLVLGGANKNGGYASNELYILDLSQGATKANWSIIPVGGIKPGRRYGHSMIYCKPNLIVFGGVVKDKNKYSNELWTLNLDKISHNDFYEWNSVQFNSNQIQPSPRMYHSMVICKAGRAKGMVMIFGGRAESEGSTSQALNETWGLRKHRDGSWEWLPAPYKQNSTPIKRYQHSAVFYSTFMIILGGRSEDNNLLSLTMPVELYDTATLEWSSHFNFDRFRHCSYILEKFVFSHGGCEYKSPIEPTDKIGMFDVSELCQTVKKKNRNSPNTTLRSSSFTPTLSPVVSTDNISFTNSHTGVRESRVHSDSIDLSNSTTILLNKADLSRIHMKTGENNFKKINIQEGEDKFKTITNDESDFSELFYENFINSLLKPADWRLVNKAEQKEGIPKFRFRREHVIALTRACQEVVCSQPIVLRVNSPVKIFGDIHGQYEDLMRFFETWGEPSEVPGLGDIHSIDYLFLGDYVDRGVNSLETICLLMALKIKYPDKIHLLRGNHEDHLINFNFGFLDECNYRLNDDMVDEDLNVFKVINEFFEYLPLAAIVEDQILCLHGGIGGHLTSIAEIEELERPLSVIHEATNKTEQIVMDILWSDPTDNDVEIGIQPNFLRDSRSYGNIVKYGPDIVERFLQNNNLSMIIRAHECVPDGFERFCGGNLITVFSATDYCKRHKNAGAMLLIKTNFEIVPHLIYPVNSGNKKWIDNEETLKKRPPTPLRRRKKSENKIEN